MKKGCFISVIVTLTIALLIIFYLVKFHGESLLELGKEKLIELAEEKIINDIDNLDNSQYADSLKIVLEDYFSNLDSARIEESLEKIDEFSDNFDVIMMDSKIDSAEFEFITNILMKHE